jgi:hypothetical protein
MLDARQEGDSSQRGPSRGGHDAGGAADGIVAESFEGKRRRFVDDGGWHGCNVYDLSV